MRNFSASSSSFLLCEGHMVSLVFGGPYDVTRRCRRINFHSFLCFLSRFVLVLDPTTAFVYLRTHKQTIKNNIIFMP